jgi:predicted secreted hydrolase
MFTGCQVEGTIKIDSITYNVNGIGHHEHTWASGILQKGIVRGWDWCHMTLDNGWNMYYSNYYFLPQIKSTKTSKINPFASLIITTNKGETLTRLEDIDVEIVESDQLMILMNIPIQTKVTAKASSTQILLKTYNIKLDIDIKADNTYEKIWKRFANVGMKIGRVTISGIVSWSEEDEKYNVELNGIGTIWNMRH